MMSGFYDDRWRDSYDAWKLASPDEEALDPRDECDHGDFDVDYHGEAHCNRCSERWMLTNDQLAAYDRLQEELQLEFEADRRRERSLWRRAWRLLISFLPRRRNLDDEIPF